MRLYNDATQEFSRLSDIRLTQDEHGYIWNNIEREIKRIPTKNTIRHSRIWGGLTASVAAVAIAVGGFAVYNHHGHSSAPTVNVGGGSTLWKNIPALAPLHYTSSELDQIKKLGQNVGINKVYILTKYEQDFASATIYANTIKLNYGDLLIYESDSISNVEGALKSSQNATLIPGNTVTLSNGTKAQWLTMKSGTSKTEVLTLSIDQTHIGMMLFSPSVLGTGDLPSVASAWTVASGRTEMNNST